MATADTDILQTSRTLGVAAVDGLKNGQYEIAETGADEIVRDMISQISVRANRGESGPVRITDDLRMTHEAYARSFMEVVKRRFPGGVVPVLLLESNEYRQPVPIDIYNPRAVEGVEALSRRFRKQSRREFSPKEGQFFTYWTHLVDTDAPVSVEPWDAAAKTFFGLLAANLWRAGISLWGKPTTSLITYTVDCINHGYVLDCWPQFYYSPKRFGSAKTHPVTAGIKPNHYKFQGWINGGVTVDPGVHPANASQTSTILGAF